MGSSSQIPVPLPLGYITKKEFAIIYPNMLPVWFMHKTCRVIKKCNNRQDDLRNKSVKTQNFNHIKNLLKK